MPVVTRAQANRIQEQEFSILRMIDVKCDETNNDLFVVTTRSATGKGTHKRWIYSLDRMLETIPKSAPQKQRVGPQEQLGSGSPVAQSLPHDSISKRIVPEDEPDDDHTPKSSLPTTPPPKRPHKSPPARVLADNDMKFLLHIKKGEDVEEALARHVRLYIQESGIRQRENYRRVYQLVKTRPELLREIGENTEKLVRDDPQWDKDPFA